MSESGPTEVDTGACGAPAAETDFGRPPAVIAGGITMRGPWGPVYGPVDLEIPDGGVTVLVCPLLAQALLRHPDRVSPTSTT